MKLLDNGTIVDDEQRIVVRFVYADRALQERMFACITAEEWLTTGPTRRDFELAVETLMARALHERKMVGRLRDDSKEDVEHRQHAKALERVAQHLVAQNADTDAEARGVLRPALEAALASDDEGLARCTALARRAWPGKDAGAQQHEWEDGHVGYEVLAGDADFSGEGGLLAFVRAHPRALDALEAAVSKLANEPPYLEVALSDAMDRMRAAEARIAELEAQLAGEAMLPSLQAWWERHALALRATSKSVHHAIGVAISALEQGKPFPTMQVLTRADDGKEGA